MASCDFLCVRQSVCRTNAVLYSPYAAQADERHPRACQSASLVDLLEYCPSLDEIGVTGKGYRGRGARWSLRSFCGAAVSVGPCGGSTFDLRSSRTRSSLPGAKLYVVLTVPLTIPLTTLHFASRRVIVEAIMLLWKRVCTGRSVCDEACEPTRACSRGPAAPQPGLCLPACLHF